MKRKDANGKQRVLGPEQAAILRLFLDPDHPEHEHRQLYGLEIMRLTRLPSGTVYPALASLRNRGLLAGEEEPYIGQAGRRRVVHTLTDPDGGRAALTERDQAAIARRRGRRTRAPVPRPSHP